ncbi:hypothetical protein TanjilG_24835 [Lupinus angustifolius]|uniref:Uncharacterized protein n=1 Tax=Lupinus angustifolius TaxID=3871 RepID=A0A1J7HGV3_LUPAN|nr:hypothetical protein TanjilG_24835 [Lupinus angustifolius]
MMLKEMQTHKDVSGMFGSSTLMATRTEVAPGKPEKAEDGSSSSTKGKEKVLVEVVEEVDEGVDEEMEHGQSEKEAVTFECNDSNQEEIEGYVVEFAVVEDDVGEEEEDI